MNNNYYKIDPLSISDEIPVFSKSDFYVKNYDRISDDHLKYFRETGHNPFMNECLWEEIEASTEHLIRKNISSTGSKILDVGVGMGRLLERFPELERYGMDISVGYLKHAKKKGINVCMSRIEDMPYRDKYFDIVCSTDVLEHVFDLNFAVKKILGVLKDDGILIVRVPYKEDLGPYLEENFPYDLVHLRNFDENNLRLLFEKIFNLQIVEFELAGWQGGRLKFGGNIRYYRDGINMMLRFLKKINRKIYRRVSGFLCKPSEINVVVRKARADQHRDCE